MPSKSKEVRLNQKADLEDNLSRRLVILAGKGIDDPSSIARDTTVRGIRANIRKTKARLKAIDAREDKKEEMARVKAEKAASPKKIKSGNKKEAEEAAILSKRQQKKKKKKDKKEADKT